MSDYVNDIKNVNAIENGIVSSALDLLDIAKLLIQDAGMPNAAERLQEGIDSIAAAWESEGEQELYPPRPLLQDQYDLEFMSQRDIEIENGTEHYR